MTTIESVTIEQIRKLSTEAHLAGDAATCADCNTLYAEYCSARSLDLADAIAAYPEQAKRIVRAINKVEKQVKA